MLLSYLNFLLISGVALAQYEREHTPAERMRLLGPLAFGNSRLVFNCPALVPSPTLPTSVHALRPADIKLVASMGDSLTAANGAKANSIVAVIVEYRGVSWCIGGDDDLKKVVTLPNILRQINSQLSGYSQGTGDRNSSKAGFNVAKAGAISSDMPTQAHLLVDRMTKALGAGKFAADWKLVTFFIGGNDLCGYCKDTNRFSTATYTNNIKTALDILKARMPRALVNLVVVLNVAELEDLHEGIRCQSLQNFMCDCAVNKKTREQVRVANLEYQRATTELISSGIYDTSDDFTVVLQPFMEHMKVPATSNGLADFSYFSPDCFHFSQKGHEAAAIELWNNMMQKVGEKTTSWNLLDTLECPTTGNGMCYLFINAQTSNTTVVVATTTTTTVKPVVVVATTPAVKLAEVVATTVVVKPVEVVATTVVVKPVEVVETSTIMKVSHAVEPTDGHTTMKWMGTDDSTVPIITYTGLTPGSRHGSYVEPPPHPLGYCIRGRLRCSRIRRCCNGPCNVNTMLIAYTGLTPGFGHRPHAHRYIGPYVEPPPHPLGYCIRGRLRCSRIRRCCNGGCNVNTMRCPENQNVQS
ncbi:unnamed protein product [Adineta steineri]|uniref:Phospholipase B1, membrane-associated n=1 Tax=Adineta steineri TaxID=433720 RepID=A0A818R2Q5_9BILA|nr:unnamed protein product [Adineta steineri]